MPTSSSQFQGLRSLRCGATSSVAPSSGGPDAVDISAPFPGASPGCQPADRPAGTPFDPSCHVHGSVRRRETATSTRPDRSRCSTSAATGSQGHSVAKCPTSQSAGPLDSIASETGWCLRSLVRNTSAPAAAAALGQRPAAAAADGDPPHDAAPDRPRRGRRRPSPGAPPAACAANSRRVIGRSSSPTRPSPARGSPSAGSRGTASRTPRTAASASFTPESGARSALVCATNSAAPAADQAVDQPALRVVGGHAVDRGQQQRVVGDQQVGAGGQHVVDDGGSSGRRRTAPAAPARPGRRRPGRRRPSSRRGRGRNGHRARRAPRAGARTRFRSLHRRPAADPPGGDDKLPAWRTAGCRARGLRAPAWLEELVRTKRPPVPWRDVVRYAVAIPAPLAVAVAVEGGIEPGPALSAGVFATMGVPRRDHGAAAGPPARPRPPDGHRHGASACSACSSAASPPAAAGPRSR